MGTSGSVILKKKEGHFGYFYRNNFDILKTYEGTGSRYWVQKESVLHVCYVHFLKRNILHSASYYTHIFIIS